MSYENLILYDLFCFTYDEASESEECEIQFGESVLLPAAEAYRRDRPDFDPNYDDPDGALQFFIALDVSIIHKNRHFFV